MLDYAGLEALAAVVREGSFERAARKLHITSSAVSQRIKLLEERVGQVLVLRGQPCTGTEAGMRLCLHVEQVALLENELRRTNPALLADDGKLMPPTLKLAVNEDSLSSWFIDAMAEFTRDGNELLDISIDDQDHTAKRIKEGSVMAAVTATSASITGCNTWPLGSMHYIATASPAFMQQHFAQGVTPQAVELAPMLGYDRKDNTPDKWLNTQGFVTADATPKHWLPSAHAFVRACEAGIGWAMQPTVLVQHYLDEGSLVELRPHTGVDIPLYWAQARNAQAGLQRLTQCVIAAAAAWLQPIDQ